MARRLGEELLLLDACEVACATLRGPATVHERPAEHVAAVESAQIFRRPVSDPSVTMSR